MVGSLTSPTRILRRPRKSSAVELHAELARSLGVERERIFLTHGATEGNSVTISFIESTTRKQHGRTPSVAWDPPEYPPLVDLTVTLGFHSAQRNRPSDLRIASDPNNPTGRLSPATQIEDWRSMSTNVLIDETFREFTSARSWAAKDHDDLWCTGTLTKAYAADTTRVGWVIAPSNRRDEFAEFHGLLVNGIPEHSIDAASSLVRHRSTILREARGIFRSNAAMLHDLMPNVPRLSAPLWFDRGNGDRVGDRFARLALKDGVLVVPGSYFGDSSGVRVTLTRRTFPQDLEHYLEIRREAPGFGPA